LRDQLSAQNEQKYGQPSEIWRLAESTLPVTADTGSYGLNRAMSGTLP
jgi:hypothetical protein